MGYEKKLARSFSQFEPQKLTFGLLLGCLLVLLTYLSITKPYDSLLSTLNLRLLHFDSAGSEKIVAENTTLTERSNIDSSSFPDSTIYSNKTKEIQMQPNSSSNVAKFDPHPPVPGYPTHVNSNVRELDLKEEKEKLVCDRSNNRFDLCELEGDVRVHIKQSSVILVTKSQRNEAWSIRPYPRKSDHSAMASVSEVAVRLSPPQGAPACSRNHSVPTVVFSAGGYSGNFFHDFSDALLPLFQTSREFDGEVVFLVSDFRSWWIRKYLPILTSLSRYPIIGLHDPSDGSVHCFPRAVVGLRTHGNLNLDPTRSRYTMVDFTGFLRKAYALPRDAPISERELGIRKPRLLIISRNRTRRFTKIEKMVRTAAKLGFEVVVAEAGGNVAAFRTCCEHVRRDGGCPWRGAHQSSVPTHESRGHTGGSVGGLGLDLEDLLRGASEEYESEVFGVQNRGRGEQSG
ncbi:hypothetical protein HPP92_004889 [Vanilla planifolia]|uniref:Uncharacterized protein n=1 Tax=Vanilla planifolia TaxID=51239 RepID=A0A835RME4_VANPL|nr:hypothetical protein HPP92_004889 [Vanilla planifolia]